MRKLAVLLAGLFIVSAGLSACGSEQTTTTVTTSVTATVTATTPAGTTTLTTTTTTTPTATTPATTTTTTPTTTTPVAPSGALRVGLANWGDEALDPPNGGALSINQMLPLYDFLVGRTIDGMNTSTETGLADKWETSADGLTWTFYLRQGVMFDQGLGEVSAEDVKFSIERNIAEGSKLPNAGPLRGLIAGIEVVDQYTLNINLNAPDMFLAFNMSAMTDAVGAVMPKKHVEQAGPAFSEKPVGSGPYRLVQWQPGQFFHYEARADYWGGAPEYKDLYIYRVTEESTRQAMLQTGELDVAPIAITNIARMEGAGFKIFTRADSNNIIGAMGRQWEGVLENRDVRLALNMAVNREELSNVLFLGRARPIDDGNYDSAALGIRTMPNIGYDPERAKALLAQAGYSGQEITLISTPGDPVPLMVEAVSGYFQAVGVNTRIVPMDLGAVIAGFKDPSRINSIAFAGVAQRGINGIPAARAMFYSDGRWDLTRDPALDALMDKAGAAETLEEFAQAQGDFYEKVHDDARLLYLVSTGESFAVSSKLGITDWVQGVGYDIGLMNLAMAR